MQKEEKIKVSAIINTYNNDRYLCETLESIRDFDEITIIDNHSNDDTVDIAKEYKTKLIYADKNELINSLNQAIQEAQNEWIMLINANEIISKKLLYEIAHYIENPKKNKFCVSFSKKTFYNDKEIKFLAKKFNLRLFKKDYIKFKNNYSSEILPQKSKIYKYNKNFKVQNGYIYEYFEDDYIKKTVQQIELNKIILKNKKNKPSILIKPFKKFIYWYFIKRSFLSGKIGYRYAIEQMIKEYIFQIQSIKQEI